MLHTSFKIGSVFGITLRLHFLLLLVLAAALALVVAGGHDVLQLALFAGVLFGTVLLHELGHGLVAQHFGIRVVDITLWPLGGMARMAHIPESTRVETSIALAGPAVNFALAALALPVCLLLTGSARETGALAPSMALQLSQWFLAGNLLLGAFNLLPAFPLDGGRVLRAWLGRKGDWLGATETAVRVGRWIAFVLAAVGVFGIPGVLPPNVGLVLVALFVWWSGFQELVSVRARHAGAPLRQLFDLLRARATPAPTEEPRPAPVAGFRPEEIAELERFRGRLSSYRDDER